MPKRDGGNRQLRAHELDAQDDQSQEAGLFKQAKPDTLKKRRIVKSRRSSTKKPKATGTPLRSNPFAGVNFASGTPIVESTKSHQLESFAPMGGGGVDDAEAQFLRKSRRLNQSFHKWVNKQMNIHEYSDWTIGVQDYITHMQKLKDKRRNGQSFPQSTPAAIADLASSKPPAPAAAKKAADSGDAGKPGEGTEDEEIKFTSRAKVFEFEKDNGYKVKGVGELRVLVHRTTQKSRLVMYDACKRLMLNLNLYKGITFKREGKNNVAFIAQSADADGKEEIKRRLIRVKTSALADSMKEALAKYC